MRELEAQAESKKKGLAIRLIRQKLGWNQATLSEKSSVSRISISKIESGKVIPNTKTVIKLCHALGITESELISNSFQLDNAPKSPYEQKISEILTKILLLQKEGY
jgi:transcriptional regulator with XRE-family HTH domain